jgi:Tol biopolymer transport system component
MLRGSLIALGLALVLGSTAAARTGQPARPRTLATIGGSVAALAQDGRRIAWINTQACCGRQVQILTLPGRRPVSVGSAGSRSCRCAGPPIGTIALGADGRVLWQTLAGRGNTELVIDLFTAALRAPRARLVADLSMGFEPSNPDYVDPEVLGVPTAAEGKAILFYSLCDVQCNRPGAIERLVGRRPRRLTQVTSPAGLAVSGRRFAVVTNSPRCCNFTPAWSHDGARLAWIYHGNLWTIHADGTRDRQLATGASLPTWSPDDARLVFEHAEANGKHGVFRVDTAGGGLQRLGSGTDPAWSPDGARIAFVRGKDVYAINPDGTSQLKLTTTARPTAGPLSWSPDSTRIAVARGGDVYSVRADGTGETRLTTSPHPEGQPTWSPNGAKIAYADLSQSSPGIEVVNADGTSAKRLTRAGDKSPTWSPDSSRIAFISLRDCCQGALWIAGADGSGQRQLVPSNRYADSPQWAPDGRSIVVGDWCDCPGNWPYDPGIRLVSPVDGKATKIAPVEHSGVEIRDALRGRLIKRFTINGRAKTIALRPDYVALLVNHDRSVRVELYNLDGSFRAGAPVPSGVQNLSAAGRNVVFATGHVIRRLDAKTGAVTVLARAGRAPVGLTIEGHRVVWAENTRGSARIREVTAP